ncbi:MAG: hypothetical protein JZU65_14175 [Chlorobium sp.]|nr:hypothetical protein [Chlorobium sp.]
MSKVSVTVAASSNTAEITGFVRVIDDTSNIGTRKIALAVDGEKGPKNSRGWSQLRGITLTKSANALFSDMVGETLLKGDVITVTVLTNNIDEDMFNGKGLGGSTFHGVGVRVVASQLDATVPYS